MKFLCQDHKILPELCKHFGMWGIMFSIRADEDTSHDDIIASAEWLKQATFAERVTAIIHRGGFVFFDTEEEMNAAYKKTLGDDDRGDPRVAKACIYALTCNPEGQLLTENT